MSVSATEAVTTGMFGTTGGADATTSATDDKEMFLQLLVAQMRYQDPMNPTDSSQFLAQSAQFTALEKMQDVADQTAALFAAQMAFGASGLIGKSVTWTDADGVDQTAMVSGVTFGASGPVLDVGADDPLPIASVLSVSDAGAAGATTSDTTSNPA